MKIIFAEAQSDYQKYFFPYQILLIREKDDKEEDIYQKGFLPFRNNPQRFYLSRSSRSNLDKYRLSSENKRIIKKTDQFTFSIKPLDQIDYQPKTQKACKEWAGKMGWKIPASSIKRLFRGDYFNWALTAQEERGKPCYYSILKGEPNFVHWGYSFQNPKYKHTGLTIRAGLEVIKWAISKNKKYVYLGTAYGKANYKRNYPGFEFFNGVTWSDRPEELKWLNNNLNKFAHSFKSDDYKKLAHSKF